MALYDTVANVVSDAAVELGLPAVSNVFSSTDANVVQLRALLKSIGQALVSENTWLQCVKEHAFVTSLASTYSLPTDFSSMVDQSGWNRTSQEPLSPLDPQEWQRLVARDATTVRRAIFRPTDGEIELWPQPPSPGETIAFEYRSLYWVAPTATPTLVTKDAPTVNTDVMRLSSLLLRRALKLAFLEAKGFGTFAAQRDYDLSFAAARSAAVGAAPVLSLNGRGGERFLSECNLPDTGFGD